MEISSKTTRTELGYNSKSLFGEITSIVMSQNLVQSSLRRSVAFCIHKVKQFGFFIQYH